MKVETDVLSVQGKNRAHVQPGPGTSPGPGRIRTYVARRYLTLCPDPEFARHMPKAAAEPHKALFPFPRFSVSWDMMRESRQKR